MILHQPEGMFTVASVCRSVVIFEPLFGLVGDTTMPYGRNAALLLNPATVRNEPVARDWIKVWSPVDTILKSFVLSPASGLSQ